MCPLRLAPNLASLTAGALVCALVSSWLSGSRRTLVTPAVGTSGEAARERVLDWWENGGGKDCFLAPEP